MLEANTIACSVGVLTHNSALVLRRCLDSLRGFDQIIIADGGSTDETLEIAREYGCTIIDQTNPGQPIEDFALERNRLLDAARHDWFFYLDSDELMTPELAQQIAAIVVDSSKRPLAYKIRYQIVSHDLLVRYASYKSYYQIRLFHKKSGGRFFKKVHERVRFPGQVDVGVIEEPWLVPLDIQLDFKVYSQKVNHRLAILAQNWQSRNPVDFVFRGLGPQLVIFLKQVYKLGYSLVWVPASRRIPLRYEMYRLYSPYVMIKNLIIRYCQLLFK